MKFMFPIIRLKIGTSEFHPNLFHKTADFFKRKEVTDDAYPYPDFV